MIEKIRLSSMQMLGGVSIGQALVSLLVAILLFVPAQAQDSAPNRAPLSPDQLFVEAVMLYHQASAKSEDEAAPDLIEVARIFQTIQSDFPESAPASLIAAGGLPGGVDLSRLPTLQAVSAEPKPTTVTPPSDPFDLSDVGMMASFLKANYPETLAALGIDPDALGDQVEDAVQLRLAYMISVFVTKSAETATDINPAEYMSVLNAMAGEGSLATAATVFSGQIAGDLIEAKLQEVAAKAFADIALSGPWPDMTPELQNMLRAGVEATFTEGWNVMKAQQDPSAIVGMVFNRVKDVRDIMVATNALNKTQEQGLIQTALSMQTAAWLFVAYPDSPGTQMAVKGALADMQSGATGIVGKDDATAVTKVFSHGFSALREAYRGNQEEAQRFLGYIRDAGADSNIPAFNVVDSLLVIANLGQDAPARAANIMIGVTALADVDAIVPFEIVRNPQPETVSTTAVSASFSAWGPEIVLPENHPVWNRRYDRRQDQRSILAELGVTKRAVEFSEAYDAEYVGDAFASEFVDLGNVDLVRMRLGHVAETSDRFRPSVVVNGSVGVMTVRGPGTNLAAQFTDSTSRKFLRSNPSAIGMYAGVFHRKLPNGGQRFVVLTGLHNACRNCPSSGTAVQFIDFDANGQFVAERNIGLVDATVAASFDESLSVTEGMTGWERTEFAANPKTLQYRLNMLGYDAGEMDGYPGPQTRQALMEFQVENCLLLSGQPTPETVAKLQKADGFAAQCAGNPLLPPLSANSPLVPGTYVNTPAWCNEDSIPFEAIYDAQRIIKPGFITFGLEEGFEIARTDIVQGLTQFKGNFLAGNTKTPGTILMDVLTPSSFREVRVGTQQKGTVFLKCPSDSPLMTSGIGVSTETTSAIVPSTSSAKEPVIVKNGVIREPLMTVDEAEGLTVLPNGTVMVDLETNRDNVELAAALMRSAGGAVVPRNNGVNYANDKNDFEIAVSRYLPIFGRKKTRIISPILPLNLGPYQEHQAEFSACLGSELSFSNETWPPARSMQIGAIAEKVVFYPRFDIGIKTGGAMSAQCADYSTESIVQFDEKFGLKPSGRNWSLLNAATRIPMEPQDSTRFITAAKKGSVRVQYGCNVEYPTFAQLNTPIQPIFRSTVCKFDVLRLVLIDPHLTEWEVANYQVVAGGLIGPTFDKMQVDLLVADVPVVFNPAAREFDVDEVGKDAIRDIVGGFVGTNDDIDLNYKNIKDFAGSPYIRSSSLTLFEAMGEDKIYYTKGSARNRGDARLKETAAERPFIDYDHFGEGVATAILGEIEDIRILNIESVAGSDCEWAVTYRTWLKSRTAFADIVSQVSGKDGFTHKTCFRTTRSGFEMVRKEIVDF